MITAGNLAGYAVASLVLIAIPGPSVLFVIGQALSPGRGPAIASVVGNAVGVYLVAFGLGTLVQRSDATFAAIKLASGLYLLWLAIQAIRHRHDLAAALDVQVPQVSRWRAARQGFVVGIANPKALIIFEAVLPQFVNRPAGHVPGQMLLLSLVSFGIVLISDSLWAVAASTVRSWFAIKPASARGGGRGRWPRDDRRRGKRRGHRTPQLTAWSAGGP
jgi:threonine/homoserine/homoserine lactone efflux protein